MRAAAIKKYGDPSVFELIELPTPSYKNNEVLVKIAAASVNPIDWKIRKGMLKYILPARFPIILGYDVCGEITAVGKDVLDFKVGDWVFARSNHLTGRAYAEFIALKADTLVKKPEAITPIEAAATPLAALTALQSIKDYGGLMPKDRILILGGAGGVSLFAVQLAKILGAHVTVTCSARNRDLLTSLGADVVIDYQQEPVFQDGQTYDVIFDAVAKYRFEEARKVLSEHGRYVTTVPSKQNLLSFLGNLFRNQKRYVMIVKNKLRELKWIAQLMEEKQLRPVVDRVFSLEEVSQAHVYSEAGHAQGKIILKL